MNFDDDDWEYDDDTCPVCEQSPVKSRSCTALGCDDGWIDRFDEDPLWCDQDHPEKCDECWGTGVERWCPKCGFDLQAPRPAEEQA